MDSYCRSRGLRDFRCIAYDLPLGDGDGAPLWRYRHDDLADDFFALLDHVHAKQAYVLGSSFGTTIALNVLHREPGRIPRALLQGAFAQRQLGSLEIALASIARILPGSTRQLPYREKISSKLNGASFGDRLDLWKYFLDTTGCTPIAAFAHQVLMLRTLDLRPILPDIRQPVLLVGGDNDQVIPRHLQETLLTGLPNARRVELEGVGHVPSYSHPELLAEVVRRFFLPTEKLASTGRYHDSSSTISGSSLYCPKDEA